MQVAAASYVVLREIKAEGKRILYVGNCAVESFTIVPASVRSQPAWLRVISLMSYCIFFSFSTKSAETSSQEPNEEAKK